MNNITYKLIDRNIELGCGTKIAIMNNKENITYSDLQNYVNNFCEYFAKQKIMSTSYIICSYKNSLAAIIVVLGLMRLGYIACIINPYHSSGELKTIMHQVNAKVILTDDEQITSELTADGLCLLYNEQKLSKKENNNHYYTETAADADAFCIFTSGTTGKPIAVTHRHKDIVNTNETYARNNLKINDLDVITTTSKIFFAYGFNALHYALYHGATYAIIPESSSIDTIWQLLERYQPSLFFSVPTMYLRLLEKAPSKINLATRAFISAGEMLPKKIQENWQQQTGKRIIDGIGATEILSTFISNSVEQVVVGSIGKIVSGFEIKIMLDEYSEATADQIGILWVKGDTYKNSYTNNETESDLRFKDGWFITNDLVSKDSNGNFYYCGRINDTRKVGGVWVLPTKIEAILNSHPAVKESAVLLKEDSNGLLRIYAFISMIDKELESQTTKQQLKAYCKESCSRWEYPHFINFVADFPKTATGKIKKYELQ